VVRRPGRDRRPRHQIARLIAAAVVLAAAVSVVGFVRGDGPFVAAGPVDPDSSSDATAPVAPVPATAASGLLVITGLFDQADLVVLAGVDNSGKTGSVLLLPTGTQIETPSFGLQPLSALPPLGGGPLLDNSVENMLGVSVSSTAVINDLGAVYVLEPAGSFDIRLRAPVRIETPNATYTWPAGQQKIDTAAAARLIAYPHVGSDLDRLVGVQAVLEGWMKQLRQPAVASATLARNPALAPLIAAAGAEVMFDVLPVRSVSNTVGAPRYLLDRDALPELVERMYPDLLIGTPGERPLVEILNGTGTIGLAQRVAEKIVPAGGEITLSGNVPGFGQTQTLVVYYRDEDAAAAAKLRDALGVGRVEKARTTLGVIDITIVAGADF